MSALRESLEFIEDWVQKKMPEHPAVMAQGLSPDEIEDKIKDLPFQVSEEIYELYTWRNGGEQPFIPEPWAWDLARFLSLEEAVSTAYDWQGLVILPLFMIEDNGYFTVCTREKSPKSPVYCSDMPEEAISQDPQYSSLTIMMQKLVAELKNRA